MTARDNSRRVTARDNSRRVTARDNSRPWQLAPLVLIERTAHVRGGCTPGNSRPWQLASLVLIKRIARVRGGCTPGNSRLGQLAAARVHREDSARPRRRRVKFFAQLSRKKAGRVWDSVPRSWWRQQAQERLKMSRWDIFRWRTLAGGPPCRQGRQRFSHRAPLSPRPKRVPPFGISDGGGTRMCAGR